MARLTMAGDVRLTMAGDERLLMPDVTLATDDFTIVETSAPWEIEGVLMQWSIESVSAEARNVVVRSTVDLTGTTPEFSVVDIDSDATSPTTWANGSWSGPWSSSTQRATAVSPSIGGAGAIAVTEGATYVLWLRIGTVVRRVGTFIVT